jgi:hypothetical protein|tara:strand:- start:734 stop:907 length:174 start_codon:yes stop_codon:yes gene_type:complete
MFFLAKELSMTVAQLTKHLTQEELVGWAAYFELYNEEHEKAVQNAKTGARARSMSTR